MNEVGMLKLKQSATKMNNLGVRQPSGLGIIFVGIPGKAL